METVLKIVSAALFDALDGLLPPEKIKEVIDKWLDKIETKIVESETKIDDIIALPAIKKLIREPFGIEDNDEPEQPAE